MINKKIKYLVGGSIVFLILFITTVSAATVDTIDPNNIGNHFAAFVHAPTNQAGSAEINFGKFTTAPSDNITISGGSLHGFAWSPIAGWIVMNCANTTSGCSTSNANFAVAVSTTGVLSGYAWGQQTGWINFGPFVNNMAPQVQISSTGNFAGTTGTTGYAWSEKYGWIVFDCSNSATCTATNSSSLSVSTTGTTQGGLSGGSTVPVPIQTPVTTTPPPATTVIHTIPPTIPTTILPGTPNFSSPGTLQSLLQPLFPPSLEGPTQGPASSALSHTKYSQNSSTTALTPGTIFSAIKKISFLQVIIKFILSIPNIIKHITFPHFF
jgi:hypothetical protein